MSRADRSGRRRRGGGPSRWLPVLLVVLLLAAATAVWRFDLAERWYGEPEPDPVREPAAVAPPEGLEVPALDRPAPVAATAEAGTLSRAALERALGPGLGVKALGRSVHAAVAPLGGGPLVYESGRGGFMPASSTKVVTATAALAELGPDHRFTTSVVGRGRNLTLVGGGDPFLELRPPDAGEWPPRADLTDLARQTARALPKKQKPVRLGYDDSLFTGPTDNPAWEPDYVPDDIVTPITALWYDEGIDPSGFGRSSDPSATAAAAFADLLRAEGVRVTGDVRRVRAPGGADELGAVRSAPLSAVVERVLEISDNEGAEVLARHVAVARDEPASFVGAGRAVTDSLGDLGVPLADVVLHDGSGLSRDNRLTGAALVSVIQAAADPRQPDLRPVLTGLPVGAFTGSLATRFDTGPRAGLGRVRAKTGTLTGVRALAGVATDRSGTPMAFVLSADKIRYAKTVEAEQDLDELAAGLGACRCSR